MGRDFSRHEWSPYDRNMRDEYRGNLHESGFGFGGTDRNFGSGGYGGYGERGYGRDYGDYGGYGYGERRMSGDRMGYDRGMAWERGMGGGRGTAQGMGYGQRTMAGWGDLDQRPGGFFGPGSGMFERERGMQRPTGRAPRGYQRSDERIKEDICDRLMRSWIDAENVEIDVKNGEVTLSGTVDNRAEKRAIEDMAEDVLGVKDVQNRIRCGQHQQQQQSSTAQPSRKPTA